MPRPTDFSSIPPSENQPTRSACMRCEGTGQEIELRVVWKTRGPEGIPLKCSHRVLSSEQAAQEMAELRAAGMLDVEVLTGVKPCGCRAGKAEESKLVAKAGKLDEPVVEAAREMIVEPVSDWKTRAAGERE